MSPRVSVLLTSYNRHQMLREAVESVLAQTFQDFELLILDDNSPVSGGVPAVLLGYWNHPKVRVFKSDVQPGERAAKVRYAVLANTGLSLARGTYVTYLCDDDLYLPRRLELMAARLDRGDCQVVYGSQRCERDGAEQPARVASGVLARASCVVDHSSVMHTRAAALEVGGWDEDPAHWRQADAQFWDRLTAAGHLFHPVPEFTDVHRYHAGSVSEAGVPR